MKNYVVFLGSFLFSSLCFSSPLFANLLSANSGVAKEKEMTKVKSETPHMSKVIFAGGCFWCMEPPFEKLAGVKTVVSGYAGGKKKNPSYKEVASGATQHREAVLITYDSKVVSFKDLLEVFWRNVNPTDAGGQFVDRGSQYATGIFVYTEEQKKISLVSKKNLETSKRFKKPVVTPILSATSFFPAEDYHQDYYKKNPLRYKYYRYNSGRDQFIDKVWGKERDYKPTEVVTSGQIQRQELGQKCKKYSIEVLKKKLTAEQFYVTKKNGTERPFKNKYWDNKEDGIYVDIVSGEALFSSKEKFKSGTGWPSFTAPIEKENIVEKEDNSLWARRTEVRSKCGDSHLGHVFNDGPAPTNLRYCINSAALKFIPVKEMKKSGYGKYLKLF